MRGEAFARQLKLLAQLEVRPDGVAPDEAAEELGTRRRTVYRDFRVLEVLASHSRAGLGAPSLVRPRAGAGRPGDRGAWPTPISRPIPVARRRRHPVLRPRGAPESDPRPSDRRLRSREVAMDRLLLSPAGWRQQEQGESLWEAVPGAARSPLAYRRREPRRRSCTPSSASGSRPSSMPRASAPRMAAACQLSSRRASAATSIADPRERLRSRALRWLRLRAARRVLLQGTHLPVVRRAPHGGRRRSPRPQRVSRHRRPAGSCPGSWGK